MAQACSGHHHDPRDVHDFYGQPGEKCDLIIFIGIRSGKLGRRREFLGVGWTEFWGSILGSSDNLIYSPQNPVQPGLKNMRRFRQNRLGNSWWH